MSLSWMISYPDPLPTLYWYATMWPSVVLFSLAGLVANILSFPHVNAWLVDGQYVSSPFDLLAGTTVPTDETSMSTLVQSYTKCIILIALLTHKHLLDQHGQNIQGHNLHVVPRASCWSMYVTLYIFFSTCVHWELRKHPWFCNVSGGRWEETQHVWLDLLLLGAKLLLY